MNPHTLLRLWAPWQIVGLAPTDLLEPAHTLEIAGATRLWPGAVYRARELGYLRRVRDGMYLPTAKMLADVQTALRNQREKALS